MRSLFGTKTHYCYMLLGFILSFSQVQQPIKTETIPCLPVSRFPDQQLMSQPKVSQALTLPLMGGIIWAHTTSSVMKGRQHRNAYMTWWPKVSLCPHSKWVWMLHQSFQKNIVIIPNLGTMTSHFLADRNSLSIQCLCLSAPNSSLHSVFSLL